MIYELQIDFKSLLAAQDLTIANLAAMCGLGYEWTIIQVNNARPTFNRYRIGTMLNALDVSGPFPFSVESGSCLTIEWEKLAEQRNLRYKGTGRPKEGEISMVALILNNAPHLSKDSVYYHLGWREKHHRPLTMYDRQVIGGMLHALDVKVLPPFYIIEKEGE